MACIEGAERTVVHRGAFGDLWVFTEAIPAGSSMQIFLDRQHGGKIRKNRLRVELHLARIAESATAAKRQR